MLQSLGRHDEAAFIYWELAEGGVEFVQSNLAELLDGGGRLLSVQSGPTFRALDLLRSIVAAVPGFRRHFVTPTSLFSLDSRPSKTKCVVLVGVCVCETCIFVSKIGTCFKENTFTI